jgi:hypothetical protein
MKRNSTEGSEHECKRKPPKRKTDENENNRSEKEDEELWEGRDGEA